MNWHGPSSAASDRLVWQRKFPLRDEQLTPPSTRAPNVRRRRHRQFQDYLWAPQKQTSHGPLRSRSLPTDASRPAKEMTCAVPVFPTTSRPSIRPRRPDPSRLTTIHKLCITFPIVSWDIGAGDDAAPRAPKRIWRHPVPSLYALSNCGVTLSPPFANVDIITANEIGVTDTCPCPIATEIVFPRIPTLT